MSVISRTFRLDEHIVRKLQEIADTAKMSKTRVLEVLINRTDPGEIAKPLLGDQHPLAKFEGIWENEEEYKIPERKKHLATERDKKLLELYAD